MTAQSAIDLDHLRQYTQGDPSLEREVFALFREQCALWLRTLTPGGDAETWRAGCHALKGSARGVGAFPLAEACAAAEALAGEAGTDVSRSVALEDLRRAMDAALAAAARLEQKASSSFR
jgi:HPt (histidine-containing phosphotransfer) domain-containing protein